MAQISLHPCLQPQTQAYPALAMCPQFAVTDWVQSIAYSPDGQHIISGSSDLTIRIWDSETGAAPGSALEGHADLMKSIAYSSDRRYIVSGSYDETTRVWEPSPRFSIRPSCKPIQPDLFAMPDMDGWVRDSEGGLLYWYPMTFVQACIHPPF